MAEKAKSVPEAGGGPKAAVKSTNHSASAVPPPPEGSYLRASELVVDRLRSLFRINDRTYLLSAQDEQALNYMVPEVLQLKLRLGINQVLIGSELYEFVLMPNQRPDEMTDAALVLATKALMNPPVMTVQNAGKEDLKQASSAWRICRQKREVISFPKLSAQIDLMKLIKSPDSESEASGQKRAIQISDRFCGYDDLKKEIDRVWDEATVPEAFNTFDALDKAESGTISKRDSAVKIATQLLSRESKTTLDRPGIPWADLIWNYWMEEAGLVQAMNVLALRFQNRAVPGKAEFLKNFELDALRPLSHFIWEYIEAEPHRLSVVRRAYEYEHEYGLRLLGKAVDKMDPYERRHGFIAGFNSLIHLAHKLFRDEDDLQRKADAFPLLNQLQELQSLVQEGAHNQYPELVKKARTEMLMQQYIFTLSPVQEFIRSRPMVVYEEPWMGPLDAMRQAMGWDPVSVSVYHKLAEKSETLLTTIRNYDWVHEDVIDAARSWAQSFRSEIQSYAHSYRTVTGVDLTESPLDSDHSTQPSLLIRQRMEKIHS